MIDETENIRRKMTSDLNKSAESEDKDTERRRLEQLYGKVWDTKEMGEEFEPLGFMAPIIVVRRRSDGKKGSLLFQHSPRFYFTFHEDSVQEG